ncbi:hypothetical protein [Paraliobacillus sediminis]|uniref:hypothetical protein n=1 Tax=Paraliobacillus sediminis TaxID=1885916 RepID=UPI000E3DCA89|nr:hypothetical protein [Paraliobacillus sediminis]
MRYELLSTEFDEEVGKRIIKVHDIEDDFTYIYYEDEVKELDIPGLKSFIQEKLETINTGVYDVPMP